jgi:hypothetical protein
MTNIKLPKTLSADQITLLKYRLASIGTPTRFELLAKRVMLTEQKAVELFQSALIKCRAAGLKEWEIVKWAQEQRNNEED